MADKTLLVALGASIPSALLWTVVLALSIAAMWPRWCDPFRHAEVDAANLELFCLRAGAENIVASSSSADQKSDGDGDGGERDDDDGDTVKFDPAKIAKCMVAAAARTADGRDGCPPWDRAARDTHAKKVREDALLYAIMAIAGTGLIASLTCFAVALVGLFTRSSGSGSGSGSSPQ